MNGTLLLRRSASIALVSSLLAVQACSVELSGLFQGDAGADDAPARDVTQDAPSTADRASDGRADTTADGSAIDGSITDGSAIDGSMTDGSAADGSGRVDSTIDARLDGDGGVGIDASVDMAGDSDGGAGFDARLDRDVARDVASEPVQDAIAEDSADEARPDVPIDTPRDAVADATSDTPADGDDAPPGTCNGGCNTFANMSQTIVRTVDQGSPPPMTGGMIVDGTYLATSVVQYNGDSTAYSIAETSVISGNMDAWVSSINGDPPARFTTTFIASSNQLAFTICCPGTASLTITYTTDGTTLRHVDPANPNRVITYTRQ